MFLTVEVQDAEDLNIDLAEKTMKFHAKSGGNVYEFELNFPEPIDKEVSKAGLAVEKQSIACSIVLSVNHSRSHSVNQSLNQSVT